MSYTYLLLISLGIAVITYIACYLIKFNLPVANHTFSFIAGLVTAVGLFVAAPTLPVQKDSLVLIVGTSGEFPPFSFIQDGKAVGFDVDLIKEIEQRIDKKIEIKHMPFCTLLPSLQLGVIQIVASGLTATPERAKQVLFTAPYLENNPLVIVSLRSAPANNLQELNNKEVVVNVGFTADLYMSTIQGPLLKRLKSTTEAFLALTSGRSAAVVTAQNTVQPFFDQYGTQLFHVAVIPNTDEHTALAITPKRPELLKQIQLTLDKIKKDGTLQKLIKKWRL